MERKEILEKIEQALERNLAELNRALDDYESASNIDEGDTMDPEDLSQQTEYKEMQMRMRVQIDQTQAQLNRLKELAGKATNTAEAGAIVRTSKNDIFIGVSFAPFRVDDKELIGITTETPVYASLRGKGKGDTFKLGKEEYTIESIQ
jgi:hypothetical protein